MPDIFHPTPQYLLDQLWMLIGGLLVMKFVIFAPLDKVVKASEKQVKTLADNTERIKKLYD